MKLMKKYLYFAKKMFIGENKSNVNLFAIEGLVLACIVNVINNNNNLFATRLGATDVQISYLQGFPQFTAMLLLIPAGIITDRVKNKKIFVALSLSIVGFIYFMTAFVPFFEEYRLYLLIGFISCATGFMTVYNSAWQSYFSDVVPISLRNKALTLRARISLFPPIILPLITGILLTLAKTNEKKIMLHQSYFIVAVILICIQLSILLRVKSDSGDTSVKLNSFRTSLKESLYDLSHSKEFLFFYVVILVFHASWYIDFTVYFVGQVQYLRLNETYLALTTICASLMQLSTIKFWSKMNEKKGVRFSIIMAGAGYSLCSASMILTTSIGGTAGRLLYLFFITLGNFGAATIVLNIFQCLLQVLPQRNKSVCISIYTTSIVFFNAVFPIIGISIYNYFGATLVAFQKTNFLIVLLRVIATLLLLFRYLKLKNTPK